MPNDNDALSEAVFACLQLGRDETAVTNDCAHPCWTALRLAAARDKGVQAMVLKAAFVEMNQFTGATLEEEADDDLAAIAKEVAAGIVTLTITEGE